MQIDINQATIRLSEQTLREVLKNLEEFKKKNPEREVVIIKSHFCKNLFLIHIETRPNSQESLGFHAG